MRLNHDECYRRRIEDHVSVQIFLIGDGFLAVFHFNLAHLGLIDVATHRLAPEKGGREVHNIRLYVFVANVHIFANGVADRINKRICVVFKYALSRDNWIPSTNKLAHHFVFIRLQYVISIDAESRVVKPLFGGIIQLFDFVTTMFIHDGFAVITEPAHLTTQPFQHVGIKIAGDESVGEYVDERRHQFHICFAAIIPIGTFRGDVVIYGFAAIEALEPNNVLLLFGEIVLFQNERKQVGIRRHDHFAENGGGADLMRISRELFASFGVDSL